MSERWEQRLAARVITQSFDDVIAPEPGSRTGRRRDGIRCRSKRNTWRRSWLDAVDFLFTPESEADRRHWFEQASLPMPGTSEGMVQAIQRYAAGPVLDDEDAADEPFEEPLIEEPVLDENDLEDDERAAA